MTDGAYATLTLLIATVERGHGKHVQYSTLGDQNQGYSMRSCLYLSSSWVDIFWFPFLLIHRTLIAHFILLCNIYQIYFWT